VELILEGVQMAEYINDHTHITSPDPKKVADFYINVMGGKLVRDFEIAGRGGQRAQDINVGGLVIRISASTGADPSLKEGYAKARGRHQYGLHHLGMKVDNMAKAVAELKAAGSEFVFPYEGSGPAFIIAPGDVLFELSQRT
jgi:catechol 2,3-dioxygenase-like lactoylglutathione lyase family enzyme